MTRVSGEEKACLMRLKRKIPSLKLNNAYLETRLFLKKVKRKKTEKRSPSKFSCLKRQGRLIKSPKKANP